MIEIHPNLFVGNQSDYDNRIQYESDWAVVHACKEPYHRNALGYSGRSAPRSHPEYLIARRANRLILNLIDVENPAYFAKEIMDTALSFIEENMHNDKRVLIHCNQGMSRSAGIALLFLASKGLISRSNFLEAEQEFKNLYPPCNLSMGVRGYLINNWRSYMEHK
jgi:hypothetical protein